MEGVRFYARVSERRRRHRRPHPGPIPETRSMGSAPGKLYELVIPPEDDPMARKAKPGRKGQPPYRLTSAAAYMIAPSAAGHAQPTLAAAPGAVVAANVLRDAGRMSILWIWQVAPANKDTHHDAVGSGGGLDRAVRVTRACADRGDTDGSVQGTQTITGDGHPSKYAGSYPRSSDDAGFLIECIWHSKTIFPFLRGEGPLNYISIYF